MVLRPRRHWRHLVGGRRHVDGDEFDSVNYSITVSVGPGGIKDQRGQITASAQALWDFSQIGGGVLRLEDGTEVDIIHLSTDDVRNVAEIYVNGALPGF